MANEKRDYRDEDGFCTALWDVLYCTEHEETEKMYCKYLSKSNKCTRPDPVSEKEGSANES